MMKPRSLLPIFPLLAVMLFWGPLFWGAGEGLAQRFPRQLENIRMFGQGESIEFIFSQPYEGTPVEEHKQGAFSLSFSGTGSTKPVRSLRPVEESIYKEIKVVQNRYSTTVTFVLKDGGLLLKDKLALTRENNVLHVKVNGTPVQLAAVSGKDPARDLLREMENRISGRETPDAAPAAALPEESEDSSAITFGGMGGGEFFYSLLSMIIALAVIVAALYGVLFLYNRYFSTRLRRFTGSHSIRQVASFHIGPRQRVVVLDINGEIVACGVTPNQISYLTHLGGKGAVENQAETAEGESGDGETPEGASRKGVPTDLQAAKSSDPVHQFAEVLKQKVRSLKRIN